jgi:hypothetical protein
LIKLINFKVELKTQLIYPSFLFCGNHERVESRIIAGKRISSGSIPLFQSVTPKLVRDEIWNENEENNSETKIKKQNQF